MKNILSKFGIYLLNFVAALWIGIVTDFAVSLVFNLIATEAPLLQARLVNGTAQTTGTLIWLFFSSKKIGYEQKNFRLKTSLFPAALMFALQAIIAYPMRFAIYIAGPVMHFTQAIHWGNREYNWQDWSEAPLSLYYGLLIAFDLLCLIAILAGEGLGAKKRQKDRVQLMGEAVAAEIPAVPVHRSGERTLPSSDGWESAPLSNAARRLAALENDETAHSDSITSEELPPPAATEQTAKMEQTAQPRKRPTPSPRPQIPPECADLRRMVNRRLIPAKIAVIASGIAFLALEIFAVWRFHETPSRMFGSTILFGLLCMAPAAVFKAGDYLSDRSFEGQVTKMEFQTKTKIGLDRRAHYYTVAKLKIMDDSGNEIDYDYLVRGTTPFDVGSRIRHYACTDYMYLLDPDKPIVCVNCGNHYSPTPEIHSDDDARYGFDHLKPMAHIPDRCGYCKMSIIKRPPKNTEEN